jgi:hypothetical protein
VLQEQAKVERRLKSRGEGGSLLKAGKKRAARFLFSG